MRWDKSAWTQDEVSVDVAKERSSEATQARPAKRWAKGASMQDKVGADVAASMEVEDEDEDVEDDVEGSMLDDGASMLKRRVHRNDGEENAGAAGRKQRRIDLEKYLFPR